MHVAPAVVPIFLFLVCGAGLAAVLLLIARIANPSRPSRVMRMPYESGMDPVHDTRRRFDVRFYLVAIAFLVFDVEVLFLYPWAVAMRPAAAAGEPQSPTQTGQVDVFGQPVALTANSSGRTMDQTPDFAVPTAATETPAAAAESLGIDAAVAAGAVANRDIVFAGAMLFIALLVFGFVYDWRKGIFRWR